MGVQQKEYLLPWWRILQPVRPDIYYLGSVLYGIAIARKFRWESKTSESACDCACGSVRYKTARTVLYPVLNIHEDCMVKS